MLQIKNLHVELEDGTKIITGLDLEINAGEVHAIMGPNGSGKSTLTNVLTGRDGYIVTDGDVKFFGENLLELDPEDRATLGLFLAFQYPVEIKGISNIQFLKEALNSQRKRKNLPPIDALDLYEKIKTAAKKMGMSERDMQRAVNYGFSGGEKKRNEIAQLCVLEPKLAFLDETDSGLDSDALRIITAQINELRGADKSFVFITHHKKILEIVHPDIVHIMIDGKIVKSGGVELAEEIDKNGYLKYRGENTGRTRSAANES